MQYKIYPPEKLKATVELPASKSISNRVLILNALSLNTNPVENLSDCEDTQVIIDAFNSDSNVFDVKGAGTAMRFLTAFLAGMDGEWIVQGSKRMHERPIFPLVDTLRTIGADIEYLGNDGYPPLKIRGKRLKGGEVYVSGSVSSQFISALMMVAPTMENGLIINIRDEIISKPYINLTAKLMEEYGIHLKWEGNRIKIKPQAYKPVSFKVESDWSAASYWYEMVSLCPHSEITLLGLQEGSYQGDANLVNLFKDLGVSTEFVPNGVIIRKVGKPTRKFFHNFIYEPDLAQTFAAACCFLHVPFIFSGVQSLRIKETDRIEALKTELKKLGFVLSETDSEMLEWDGERCFAEEDAVIDTYDDHRMAMSLSPAAIPFKSVIINDPQVVNKSYPNFWDDLKKAGFRIQS
ncbi:MAG TPA: 3-phosphoshikimate 1-carboxyvinyltransferase [Petrimonas sp.]|uniref:3-phosphoshikimate 1-carboxyvinyltransferase n=1 Tax=Petrimonas sp. TaxID=2023866 RepID=UPI001758D0C5|nr:3-phosphoshikimate 1-carboxyvinyltransferase [Petrimonas sp.]